MELSWNYQVINLRFQTEISFKKYYTDVNILLTELFTKYLPSLQGAIATETFPLKTWFSNAHSFVSVFCGK